MSFKASVAAVAPWASSSEFDMRLFRLVCLALCCLALFGACRATNSVELFRVNDNGEVVNIGRGSDDEHIIYGHFRLPDVYDRAFVTVQDLDADQNSVCYVKINAGQVKGGVGMGIRLSPCNKAKLVNEVATANGLDGIGIYDLTRAPWGTYILYFYDGSTFVPLIERPFFDEHLNAGLDSFRVNPENPDEAFVTYSHKDENGRIVMIKETVAIADVLSGKLLRLHRDSGDTANSNEAEDVPPSTDSLTIDSADQTATESGQAPTATESGQAPTATGSGQAPTATESGQVPTATESGQAPTTTESAQDEAIDDMQAVTPDGKPIPREAIHRDRHN